MTGAPSPPSGHSALSGEIATPITPMLPPLAAGSAARFRLRAGGAWRRPAPAAPGSAATSSAGLSSRRPLKAAWRTMAVAGPAGELDLGHQLRAYPVGACPRRGASAPSNGDLVGLQRLEPRQEPGHRVAAEAGADPADVDQLAVAVDARDQRAEGRGRRWSSRRSPPRGRPRHLALVQVSPRPER